MGNDGQWLEGIHGTVPVPTAEAGFWRKWRAFVGPAILVSVGYMDPGELGAQTWRRERGSNMDFCGWWHWPA